MIKKIIKFSLKAILVSSILISLLLYCGFKYVEHHIKESLTTPLYLLEKEISSTKVLPDNIPSTFHEIYETKHISSYITESHYFNIAAVNM